MGLRGLGDLRVVALVGTVTCKVAIVINTYSPGFRVPLGA